MHCIFNLLIVFCTLDLIMIHLLFVLQVRQFYSTKFTDLIDSLLKYVYIHTFFSSLEDTTNENDNLFVSLLFFP